MKFFFLTILFFLTMLISCGKVEEYDCMGRENFPVNSFVSAEKAKKLAEIVCNCINEEELPCIQLTVIDSLGEIWTLSTGTIDKKRTTAVTNDHQFRIASITKTFTATIIFKLIEEGKLSPDDLLIHYFPEFKYATEVTIKNLLNHSSGIKDILTLADVLAVSTMVPDKIWDINSIINTISKKKLVFATGSDCQYSNTNYILLGLIAEQITGNKMNELYREYIFEKIAVNDIALVPQEETPENLISGYDRQLLPTPGWYEVTPQNTAWSSAAFTSGAIVGSSEQTGIFFHHLFAGNLISPNSVRLMEDFTEKKQPDNEYQKYFGSGLFKFDINGQTYYGHEGLFIGADNIACYRVSDETVIIIFSNISSFNKFRLLEEIDAAI